MKSTKLMSLTLIGFTVGSLALARTATVPAEQLTLVSEAAPGVEAGENEAQHHHHHGHGHHHHHHHGHHHHHHGHHHHHHGHRHNHHWYIGSDSATMNGDVALPAPQTALDSQNR